jgi:phospholipid/cholesterol/gamma-HCH transport system ATP-binding protein
MMDFTDYDSNTIVDIKALSKSFGSNAVLKNFTLQLKEGENTVVIGKSGSGKSVLIKCIIGLMQADTGSIKVFGTDVATLNSTELDQLRAKVGFLFQSNALYDSMTVRENLEFPLRRHWLKDSKVNITDLVLEALTQVGLAKSIDLKPSELSGGMRKRIALARTLILKPKIILYDEPTSGLDPVTGKEISQLIVDIQKKNKTTSIIISHDLNCAKITANHIVILWEGACYAQGSFDELQKSEDPIINQFFN